MADEPFWVTIVPIVAVAVIIMVGLVIMGNAADFKIETLKQACIEDSTVVDKNFCENQVYTALSEGTYQPPWGTIMTDVVTT